MVNAFTGVPGVLINIAGIAPPYIADPYIPKSNTRLTKSSRNIVAGRRIAIAIAGPIPGIAPIITPPTAPTKIAIITCM